MIKYLFRVLARTISQWNFYIIKSLAFDPGNRLQIPINLDFVRHKTLELCCNEIRVNKVEGNVAELGVYKGDFAIKINELFPAPTVIDYPAFRINVDLGSDGIYELQSHPRRSCQSV